MNDINRLLEEIGRERLRQVAEEGHSAEHDDARNCRGDLADAAACYAAVNSDVGIWYEDAAPDSGVFRPLWPWADEWNKKRAHGRKKQLIIAGALIIAELERLERAGEIR